MLVSSSGILALALASTTAIAQTPTSRPPTAPDSVLTAGAAGTAFAAWRSQEMASGRSPAPIAVQGGAFDILLLPPLAADGIGADSLIARLVTACRAYLALSRDDSVRIVATRPWQAFDDAAAARPVITISVLPVHGDASRCDRDAGLARQAAVARGMHFGLDTLGAPTNDITRLELWVDGRMIPPVLSGRARVSKLGRSSDWTDGTEQARLYVELDAFPVEPGVAYPRAELRVFDRARAQARVIVLPETAIRRLWWSSLEARAVTRLHDGTDASRATIDAIPRPSDPALRQARAALEEGRALSATMAALSRLRTGVLSDADRRSGTVQVALSFAEVGDTVAGRYLVREQMDRDPCLAIEALPGTPLRRLADPVRPRARCTSQSVGLVATRSLLPGLGQLTEPRRLVAGLAAFALVGGSLLYAVQQQALSEQRFAAYESAELTDGSFSRIRIIYDEAEEARIAGNRGAMIGAVAWVGAAAEAILTEYRHARRIRAVERYGEAVGPRVSFFLFPIRESVGVGMTFAFAGGR